MSRLLDPTALLTIGPFFPRALAEADNTTLTGAAVRGTPIVLAGKVMESSDQPVRNAVVEIWQPDADGLFAHPADPRAGDADPNFRGWGRCATNAEGWYSFRTVMPGARADNAAGIRLPHINMMLLASGIMRRLTTTLFFTDDVNAADPVMGAVPTELRSRLLARRSPDLNDGAAMGYRFDVVLQGAAETPFFLD